MFATWDWLFPRIDFWISLCKINWIFYILTNVCFEGLPIGRRQWHPTPVLLPGKSHGRRSLVGCSPWGCQESDMTEQLHFHFSLSCIGEGNGNPLQGSCLENPRDRGAWWAAVYGVAQSRTRLKRLSSSSSNWWIFKIARYSARYNVNKTIIVFYNIGTPHSMHFKRFTYRKISCYKTKQYHLPLDVALI